MFPCVPFKVSKAWGYDLLPGAGVIVGFDGFVGRKPSSWNNFEIGRR
jgi:hypothetical protein